MQWRAVIARLIPGHIAPRGTEVPPGTVTLHAHLLDAHANHVGRPVHLIIDPSQLETVATLLVDAMTIRDGSFK